MNEDLNFKSWKIEDPSGEQMEEIFNRAKSKVVQKRRSRRIRTGAAAAIIASVAVLYGLFGRSSFKNELVEARKMIENEIRESRDMVYYAENERWNVSFVREDYYDFHF